MKNKKAILFISVISVIGLTLFYNQNFFGHKLEELKCKQNTQIYFDEQNERNSGSNYGYKNYSFAANSKRIMSVLGENYKHVAVKGGDCFAIIRYYDSNVDQYAYHIYSVSIEKNFMPRLFENDYDPKFYSTLEDRNILETHHQVFIENYNKFFK